jgi:hypothetical protein
LLKDDPNLYRSLEQMTRFTSVALAVLALAGVGCADMSYPTASPTRPDGTLPQAAQYVPGGANGPGKPFSDSHGNELFAVVGTGFGMVNTTPEASNVGLNVEFSVCIHDAEPNATFFFSRASTPLPRDATTAQCSNQVFLPFPRPNPGPLATIETNAAGSGCTHIKFNRALSPEGSHFAVIYQVSTASGSNILRTNCAVVEQK